MNHDPVEPHIQLSEDAPHRLRRADDREELRIRALAWEEFKRVATDEVRRMTGDPLAVCMWENLDSPLSAALDLYRQELAALAIKRMGVRLP